MITVLEQKPVCVQVVLFTALNVPPTLTRPHQNILTDQVHLKLFPHKVSMRSVTPGLKDEQSVMLLTDEKVFILSACRCCCKKVSHSWFVL